MARLDWGAIERRGGEVIRPAGWRLIVGAVGFGLGAAFAAALVALIGADGVRAAEWGWLIAWVGLLTLWGWLAFRSVRRLIRREPLVAYDDEGLHLPGVGTVGWSEIDAIRLEEVGRGRGSRTYVGVVLREPREVLARASLGRRIEGRVELAARRPALAIHATQLPLDLFTLAQRLRRRHEQATAADVHGTQS